MAKNHTSDYYSFSDKPITLLDQDALGSVKFANSLAKSIAGWNNEDCLVIGLYGNWGNGKTSIKNLCLEEIANSFKDEIQVVEYNPWSLDGSKGLIDGFFNKISADLDATGAPEMKEASQKMKSLSTIFKGSVPAITLLSNLAAPGSGQLLESLLKNVPEILTSDAEKLAEQAKRSFKDTKADLETILSNLKKHILIVVDDIDRLNPEDICTLFKLIKNTADFPNVIYLLLFDKEVVVSSLTEFGRFNGREYLQKIVQVDLDIPKLSNLQLRSYAEERLEKTFAARSIACKNDRYIQLLAMVPHFAKNLRAIHRLLNSYSFQLAMATNENELDVNPVDLLGIDILRIFETDIFNYIFEHLDIFAPNSLNVAFSSRDDQPNRFSPYWTELQGLFHEKKKHIPKLISLLFPAFAKITIDKSLQTPSEEEMIQSLRICHERLSKRYFHFVIEREDLSQNEVNELLEVFDDKSKFIEQLQNLNKRDLLVPALGYLLDYGDKLKTTSFCENLPIILGHFENYSGPLKEACRNWTFNLIHKCLMKENSLAVRSKQLKKALKDSDAYYAAVLSIHFNEASKGKELLTTTDISLLKNWIIRRLQSETSNGKLIDRDKMGKLLYVWGEWGSAPRLKSYLSKIIKEVDGLLSFAFSQSYTTYKGNGVVEIGIKLSEMTKFIELRKIEQTFKKIDAGTLDTKDLRIYKALGKALNKKKRSSSKFSQLLDDDMWEEED